MYIVKELSAALQIHCKSS